MQSDHMTKEMKRYYLYNFIISVTDTGNGNFTMVYFYFHGFSIVQILCMILTYGLTCLVILKPVGVLLERIGPQATFRLHIVSELLKYAALVSIFVFPVFGFFFSLLLQFFNGFNVMLSRIPLTAYFSTYSTEGRRGSEIGFTNNIVSAASVVMPIAAGFLIQQSGLLLIGAISVAIELFATFILRFDRRVVLKNPVKLKKLSTYMPKSFSWSFFVSKLVYPYAADLVSIYIAITLKSFVVLGIFVGIRTAMTLLLNYLVGKWTDERTIRPFFFVAVIISSLFWFVILFIHEAYAIVILQFTLGLAGLVTSIPYECAYHALAEKEERSLEFAVWREILIQAGLSIGTLIIILVIQFLHTPWQSLLPLGALSALALLFAMPYIGQRIRHS